MSVMNPYLNFRGQAKEALEFYHSVFGGELTVSSFAEMGMDDVPEAERGLVMHGQLETPAGFTLMASDVPSHMDYVAGTNQFSISLSGPSDDDAELRGYWQKLGEGATIVEPLATAPWGASFGMLTDRFGIAWLVNISADAA
ncbi:VOC family protein [Pseudolysinimonas yzui]|uniref:VOC family protein n=1 Tax=Pseudolysinimonas yzui TaxID=2708254 RepID=A0A8J3GPE7_9MICO|nr:VOC family protein [Pseudolysinimonas yzui]GHF10449.1 VOC family protein [Pseudolysinimonas yzui]